MTRDVCLAKCWQSQEMLARDACQTFHA